MKTPLQHFLEKNAIKQDRLSALGFSESRINGLYQGSDPTVDEVRTIAKHFHIQVRRLISNETFEHTINPILRQNFSTPNFNEEIEIEDIMYRSAALSEILDARDGLRRVVDLGQSDKSIGLAEKLAYFVREQIFNADLEDPIVELDKYVITRTSAYVIVIPLRKIEGATITISGKQFIYLAERPSPRMRFTLAHELCHYLVDLPEIGGWLDEHVLNIGGSEQVSERFANSFAAALLLPASAVGKTLRHFRNHNAFNSESISDVEVALLSRYFEVSFQVAARRCEDLQLIPKGGGQALYESVKKRYKTPEKFADAVKLPARSSYAWDAWAEFMTGVVEKSVDEERSSIGRMRELVNLPY